MNDFRALLAPQGSGWHEGIGAWVGCSGWRWADSLAAFHIRFWPRFAPQLQITVGMG
jgi:hypothetical protein